VCSLMIISLIIGFNLTPNYGYVTGSVWSLVANICTIDLSFLLIDNLAMLVENPVSPDIV
jgi:hypothetical protein